MVVPNGQAVNHTLNENPLVGPVCGHNDRAILN
ncbi:hypothetical protein LCGC14_2218390, partial [marine sediment metagenome]